MTTFAETNAPGRAADLPVAVIGAGPQGLAAAAHLLERGLEPLVLEKGDAAGAAVAEWGDVQTFSEWPELVDQAARRLLEPTGWSAPSTGFPTGREWAERYLIPLGAALGPGRVRTGARVVGVARAGRDRVESGRAAAPFELDVTLADGTEERLRARAVIDASGTWSDPNPAGASGLPALGERRAAAAGLVSYRIPASAGTPVEQLGDGGMIAARPDTTAATSATTDRLAGKHLVVIGSGHSASHAVIRLAALVRRDPATRVEWLIRRAAPSALSGSDDQLPARGALGGRARQLVDDGLVTLVSGFRTVAFQQVPNTQPTNPEADAAADSTPAATREAHARLTVISDDGRRIEGVDHVFALTGFRPDTSMLSELRTALDPALDAVAGLAEQIDPNVHSCGTVRASGALELAQPEPHFFIVGAKSYGRAPTFLALTGYEQVRSVVAELAGDHEAAARNELVLPKSGVCGGASDLGGTGASCCAPTGAQPIQLGRRPEPARP